MNRRRSLIVIALAAALDLIGGIFFATVEHLSIGIGLYWAITTATTVGYGDVSPKTTAGHFIAVAVMLTVIPLFAATFSLLTSGLTAVHVHKEGQEARRRLDHIIEYHPDIPNLPSSPLPSITQNGLSSDAGGAVSPVLGEDSAGG